MADKPAVLEAWDALGQPGRLDDALRFMDEHGPEHAGDAAIMHDLGELCGVFPDIADLHRGDGIRPLGASPLCLHIAFYSDIKVVGGSKRPLCSANLRAAAPALAELLGVSRETAERMLALQALAYTIVNGFTRPNPRAEKVGSALTASGFGAILHASWSLYRGAAPLRLCQLHAAGVPWRALRLSRANERHGTIYVATDVLTKFEVLRTLLDVSRGDAAKLTLPIPPNLSLRAVADVMRAAGGPLAAAGPAVSPIDDIILVLDFLGADREVWLTLPVAERPATLAAANMLTLSDFARERLLAAHGGVPPFTAAYPPVRLDAPMFARIERMLRVLLTAWPCAASYALAQQWAPLMAPGYADRWLHGSQYLAAPSVAEPICLKQARFRLAGPSLRGLSARKALPTDEAFSTRSGWLTGDAISATVTEIDGNNVRLYIAIAYEVPIGLHDDGTKWAVGVEWARASAAGPYLCRCWRGSKRLEDDPHPATVRMAAIVTTPMPPPGADLLISVEFCGA